MAFMRDAGAGFSTQSQPPQPFLSSGDRSVKASSAVRVGGAAGPEPNVHPHFPSRKETIIMRRSIRSLRTALAVAAALIAILATAVGGGIPAQASSSSGFYGSGYGTTSNKSGKAG